jgi:hypothetical protein
LTGRLTRRLFGQSGGPLKLECSTFNFCGLSKVM